MSARALALAGAIGCAAPAAVESGERRPADFVGPAGLRVALAPADTPDDPPLQVVQTAEVWEVRLGSAWDDATPVASWPVQVGDALVVDTTPLLEAPIGAPEPVETWYGKFPEGLVVEVPDGPFAGEWALAAGIGPVVLTLDGVRRECVTYEAGAIDTGA